VADNVVQERHLAVHGQAVQDLHGEGLDREGGRAAAGQGRHSGGRGRSSSHRLHQRQHRGLEQILHTTGISQSQYLAGFRIRIRIQEGKNDQQK
jgi:hypothetical protein